MPAEKFSVSLPADLAQTLEEFARADGSTRSAVVREATAAYVARRREAERASLREHQVGLAIELLDDVACSWGEDSLPGAQYLAGLRSRFDGAEGPTDES